jgi:golgi-specific brefeldin A-resistance guanine nucleotide exchange factor 1
MPCIILKSSGTLYEYRFDILIPFTPCRPIVFEHLSALLSASTQYSILLIERAVVGLLRLCLILAQKVRFSVCPWILVVDMHHQPSLRDQIYISFDLLVRLPPVITNSVAEPIVAGIILILQKNKDIIRSVFPYATREARLKISPW